MKQLLLRLKRFCGYAVGFVFLISGLLKLMDPVGASLVMKEYFQFMHLGFMEFADTFLGVAFALTEALIGAALITGVWRSVIALSAIILQGFFTILTLFLVIFQPEMDCGCFGEAIHLSHTETFVKNLILLTLLLIYYIPKRHLGETKKKKYVSFGIACVSILAFMIYSILYIPMMDFTDLRPGTIINKTEVSPDEAYDVTFIYSKDGKEEEFTLENLPDSTWTYIDTKTIQKKEDKTGYTYISIYNNKTENNDTDEQLTKNYADSLLTKGKVMIVSIYDQSVSSEDLKEIQHFLDLAKSAGFQPLLLTSSIEVDSPYHYFCDYKTLITLNRSSGGATYIDNGMIIRKWSKRTLPDQEDLTTLSNEDSTDTFIGRDTRTGLAFQGFLLYVFAVMLLL